MPMQANEIAAWLVLALFIAGACALVAPRRPLVSRSLYGASALLCALLAAVALGSLLGLLPQAPPLSLPVGLPFRRTLLGFDPLSAAFAVIVNGVTAIVSCYAIGYGAHAAEPRRVLPFYPVFVGGMNVVLLAGDAFAFLAGWEFMSLASWGLVVSDDRSADNRRAGLVYLIMATGGALTLLLAFGLLAGSAGGFSFTEMRLDARAAPGMLVLLLALAGTGSKSGLVPLHAWLPLAHPAAPSHVSALMSGVMTKVAVYGFVRIAFDLLGPPVWTWSIPVLLLAGATTLMGVLYALMQHDLKRLLAYHTVENIGIVFIGLGLGLAFKASGNTTGAALAVTAALFHVLNHSLFKSLLFLGAGAVLRATGTRDMEELGGLIHRMPGTALCFLVGCVAISALPPLNGFVSEWLTFQAILASPALPQWILKFLIPAVGATLACAAALAAACFVKAFGATFLGRARTPAAAAAGETDAWSVGAMALLATLCLLAGVLPGYVMDGVSAAAAQAVGGRLPPQSGTDWLRIVPLAGGRSAYSGLLVLALIGGAAAVSAFTIHRAASRRTRRAAAWDCGFPDPSPATQYTSGSFAQPIRRVFGTALFRAHEQVALPPPGDTRAARLEVTLRDTVWDVFYAPVIAVVGFLAERSNRLQFLTIRRYLTLVFIALLSLLVTFGVWR
jgi:formate hydrogenlyase subunit 3/multisubunit Na+/H+ antiporter MnhD subunit